MKQIEVPYEVMEKEMTQELSKLGSTGDYLRGILATSADDVVTARKMWMVPDGLKIYCWSTPNSRKHKQILANPNVAVVAGFVQLDGVAELLGHPKDEAEFLEAYKKAQPDRHRMHTSEGSNWHSVNRVLIKVTPKRIALSVIMRGENSVETVINVLNVTKGKAYRIHDFDKEPVYHSDAPAYSE